jgi:radical SAM-linked protein
LEEVFALNSIRVRFVRGEEVKFISHLDLMKVFDRAIRRAGIPIVYSEGFNPHPHMVFGLPLSVGVTSQAEYADFDLEDGFSPDEFMKKLNSSLPPGFKVMEAKIISKKSNIMASINAASYSILFAVAENMDDEALAQKLADFMQEDAIVAEKEGKKGKKAIDIKPMIIRLELKKPGDEREGCRNANKDSKSACSDMKYMDPDVWLEEYVESLYRADVLPPSYERESIRRIDALLSAGSMANLKPELLIETFGRYIGQELKIVKIHRTGLFVEKEGKLLEPLDGNAL